MGQYGPVEGRKRADEDQDSRAYEENRRNHQGIEAGEEEINST